MEEMDNTKISVAMASYNCHNYISEAIISIVKQTYKNWEIVVVIDGGDDVDSTIDIVKNLARQYKIIRKIKLYTHDKNYGYGSALKNAIEMGTGELVAIVDADDALSDNSAFEIMVNYHKMYPDASLIYSDFYECDKNLKNPSLRRCSDIPDGKSFLGYFIGDKYYSSGYIVSHLKVFKRRFYDKTIGLDYTLLKAVDKDLILKLEEVGRLIHIPIPLYLHRKNPRSISSTFKLQAPSYRKAVIESKNRMYSNAIERRKLKNIC